MPSVIDATATEQEVRDVVASLVRALKPCLVVETGAYLGGMTEAIAREVAEYGVGTANVVSCEPRIDYWAIARSRTRPYIVADVRNCISADVPELEAADFLFLDSDYRYREEEIRRAKKGATIVVHDAYKSYDPSIAPLAPLIGQMGGITFRCGIDGRGFGILVKT